MFRVRGRTWGVADIYRLRGRPRFTERDVAFFDRIGTAVASALRGLVVQEHPVSTPSATGSVGTALFAPDGRLISFDDQADQWFSRIAGPQWADLPPAMSSATAVVSRAVNVRSGRDRGSPIVQLRTGGSEWVTMSGSLMRNTSGSSGPVAVSVSRSLAWEVAPLLAEAFGLTPREQQVCKHVARGLSNKTIAAECSLSAHTVRDHLKAAYAKLGVSSRGELTAKLFSDIYSPRLHAPDAEVTHASF